MKAAKFYIKEDGKATLGGVGVASDLLKEVRGIASKDFPKGVTEIHVWTASKGKVKQVRLANVKLQEANRAKAKAEAEAKAKK